MGLYPTRKWKLDWRKNHSVSVSWIDEKIIVILGLNSKASCKSVYLLFWFGIRGNAFRAAYAVFADCQQQQQQTNKPKKDNFKLENH